MVGLQPRPEPHGHSSVRDSAPSLAQSPRPLYGTTMCSPVDIVMLGVPDEEPCFSSHGPSRRLGFLPRKDVRTQSLPSGSSQARGQRENQPLNKEVKEYKEENCHKGDGMVQDGAPGTGATKALCQVAS